MPELRTCVFCGQWLFRHHKASCRLCDAEGCTRCIPPPLNYCIDCQEDIDREKREREGRAKP